MARPPERDTTLPARAVTELERVPALLDDFEAHAKLPPILGSLCWADRKLGVLGERPNATASMKLAVALEHAGNVRRLLLDCRTLPIWSHLTLLRPVFEASVQATWLLDSSVTPDERVGRAVGAALESLDERRKAEDALRARRWTPSASYQSATARADQVTSQAAKAGIAITPMLDTVSLLGRYSLVAGESNSFWWRYASGVLHTEIWAALLGEAEQWTGETFWGQRHEADVEAAANIIVAAIHHLDAAVKAYVNYVEPPASASP